MVKLLHQLPQMDSVNLGLDKDLPEHFRNSVRGLLEEYEKRVKVDQQNLSNDMGEIFTFKLLNLKLLPEKQSENSDRNSKLNLKTLKV